MRKPPTRSKLKQEEEGPPLPSRWKMTPSDERFIHEAARSALMGMIASAPLVDRTKVNKRVWSSVAYSFAEAMFDEALARGYLK